MTQEELEIAQAACCVGTMWDQYEGTEKFNEMVGKRVWHLIELVRNHLEQEQLGVQNGKFVFPKYLYARTKDNKTIDMSYVPQDMTAIEYVRNDLVQQEQSPKGYDEAYLNECIAKASKTWKGVDADKYLDEMRGREQDQPEIKSYIEELLKECACKDGEYYRSRRETLAHLFAYLGGNPSEYILQPVEQPEVDLEKYIEREVAHYGLSLYEASYGTFSASQIDRIIRNAFELGLNARKEK